MINWVLGPLGLEIGDWSLGLRRAGVGLAHVTRIVGSGFRGIKALG